MVLYTRHNSLRLKDWDYTDPGPYFVTICTLDRIGCFLDSDIRHNALDVMIQANRSFSVVAHAVCIAEDHIHLLMTLPDKKAFSLGSHIARLKVTVSKSLLEQNIRWQRSFYDHVVRNEKDFNEKARYIENHPYKEMSSEYSEWH